MPEAQVAWRGVMLHDGTIWAWPTLLFEHRDAFAVWPPLESYAVRWRQWEPGGRIDYDDERSVPGDMKAAIEEWVDNANKNYLTV